MSLNDSYLLCNGIEFILKFMNCNFAGIPCHIYHPSGLGHICRLKQSPPSLRNAEPALEIISRRQTQRANSVTLKL